MFRKPIIRKISWWVSLIFFTTACFVWLGSFVAALVISLPTGSTTQATKEFEYYDGYSMICMDGKACMFPFTFEEGLQFKVQFDSLFRESMKETIFNDAQRKAAFGDLEKSTCLLPLWIPVLALGILFALFTRRSVVHKELKSHLKMLGIFRKPIARKFSWWATLVLLVVLSVSWVGSYLAGLYAFIPTSNNVRYTHVMNFCDGYSIFCDKGDICMWSFALGDSFKCGFDFDARKRSYISDMVDETRREATWGIVFDFEKRWYLLPLWMPLIAFGIPFAYFKRKSILRDRLKTDGIAYRWMPNRRSKPICLVMAALVFVAVPWISFEAGKNWLISNYGDDFLMTISQRYNTPDAILYGGALAIWLVFSYTVARMAYGLFGRKRIPISENGSPLCLTCRFNLKGNTTGICPECGTAIT